MKTKLKTIVVSETIWNRFAEVKLSIRQGRQMNGMSSATTALKVLLDFYEKNKPRSNDE